MSAGHSLYGHTKTETHTPACFLGSHQDREKHTKADTNTHMGLSKRRRGIAFRAAPGVAVNAWCHPHGVGWGESYSETLGWPSDWVACWTLLPQPGPAGPGWWLGGRLVSLAAGGWPWGGPGGGGPLGAPSRGSGGHFATSVGRRRGLRRRGAAGADPWLTAGVAQAVAVPAVCAGRTIGYLSAANVALGAGLSCGAVCELLGTPPLRSVAVASASMCSVPPRPPAGGSSGRGSASLGSSDTRVASGRAALVLGGRVPPSGILLAARVVVLQFGSSLPLPGGAGHIGDGVVG